MRSHPISVLNIESQTGTVVTVLEIFSPKNKRDKEGRKAYENKQKQVLASLINLVEIDLLRSGKPMRIIEKIQSKLSHIH